MGIIVLIFLLLSTPSVRKIESCSSTNHNEQPYIDGDEKGSQHQQFSQQVKAEKPVKYISGGENSLHMVKQQPAETPKSQNLGDHLKLIQHQQKEQEKQSTDTIANHDSGGPHHHHDQVQHQMLSEKHTEHNSGVHHEKTVYECKFLIIGGGPQTVALLAILLTLQPKTRFRIIIVEKKSNFGTGWPYDWDVVTPEHLTNVYFLSGVSITFDPDDFVEWVSTHPDLFGLNDDPQAQVELPPARDVVGKYLHAKFEQLYTACLEKYDIELMNNTAAEKVSRGNSGFTVSLQRGKTVHTTDIFLATGHGDSSPFDDDIKGYFRSPWPASDLTDKEKGIPANAHTGVLGTGPNAIDAVMTLAHEHGTFTKKKPNGFSYKPDSDEFLITMYSRSGHLPTVSGKDEKIKTGHMTKLIKEQEQSNGYLKLEDVFAAMKKDLVETKPGIQDKIDDFWDLEPEEFFEGIDAFMYTEKTSEGRLNESLQLARNSWNAPQLQNLQPYFLAVQSDYEDAVKYFSAEDIIAFKRLIAPSLVKIGRPMPVLNAEKLLALMKAECLKIVPVGHKSKIVKDIDNGKVRVQFGAEDIPHQYFVDATGTRDDMQHSPSPLVQSLLENDFIQTVLVPFETETGEKAHKEEQENGGDRIELLGETYFYRAGGVEMDMETMRVVPAVSTPGVIYASGPFTFARYVFGHTLSDVVEFAERAAVDMAKTRFEKYSL